MVQKFEFRRVKEISIRVGKTCVRYPYGEILSAGYNSATGDVVIWVLHESDGVYTNCTFAVVGNNENLPQLSKTDKYAGCKWKYISSVQPSGRSILHVFRLTIGVA